MTGYALGPDGLALIKEFEGYHTAQPDGSCVAYLCPARVPTIGWGCTKGVRLGMRWTAEQAEAALMQELAEIESAVSRLVTVPLSQQQYDALVSFTYNVGSGALKRSTLLKKLNAGDYSGAEQEFAKWNKGGGRVLKGLVRRRSREALLFGTPVEHETVHVADMPQKVDKAVEVPAKTVAAGIGTAAGATSVANMPEGSLETFLTVATKMASFASSSWTTVAAIGGVTLALLLLPKFVNSGDDE